MKDIIEELEKRRDNARLGGGQGRIDSQHGKGKLTAALQKRDSKFGDYRTGHAKGGKNAKNGKKKSS